MEDKMRSNRDPEGRALDCADCGGTCNMGNHFWTQQYMDYLSTFDEDAETDDGEIAKNDALHIGEAITVHEFQYDVPPNPERTKWQWKNKHKNKEEGQ